MVVCDYLQEDFYFVNLGYLVGGMMEVGVVYFMFEYVGQLCFVVYVFYNVGVNIDVFVWCIECIQCFIVVDDMYFLREIVFVYKCFGIEDGIMDFIYVGIYFFVVGRIENWVLGWVGGYFCFYLCVELFILVYSEQVEFI